MIGTPGILSERDFSVVKMPEVLQKIIENQIRASIENFRSLVDKRNRKLPPKSVLVFIGLKCAIWAFQKRKGRESEALSLLGVWESILKETKSLSHEGNDFAFAIRTKMMSSRIRA
jgi:hypothetical protein